MQNIQEALASLLKMHDRCLQDLFVASTLHCTGEEVHKGVFLAEQGDFADWSQLETFVRRVYAAPEAARLLTGKERIYENADGRTAVILDHVKYLPLFADWSRPEILSVEAVSDGEAKVRISLPPLLQTEEEAPESYEVALNLVLEEDGWKLEACYH